jgi:site-specific DNA-cytosine methylase
MPTFYMVELFSGGGSFGRGASKQARALGYDVRKLSVDIHPKYHPSVCVDVLTWDYKRAIDAFLPQTRRSGDVVWAHASPPCNEFSRAKTSYPRDLLAGDALVKRALRIIKYARPHFWTLENPVGLLQTRPYMQRLEPYKLLTSYCRFGRPFRKDTNIWTNVAAELPRCAAGSYCSAKARLGHHLVGAQHRDTETYKAVPVDTLYAIPEGLSRLLVRSALLV